MMLPCLRYSPKGTIYLKNLQNLHFHENPGSKALHSLIALVKLHTKRGTAGVGLFLIKSFRCDT